MAEEDVGLVLDEAKEGMDRSLRKLRAELQKVRTGRASTALLDGIQVEYYGTPTPMNQLANLTTPDPRLIVISPFDKSVIAAVEKAIQTSDLGLTPSNDGKVVRIPIPPLTEERRKEIVKKAHDIAESGRNAVRQARRDGNEAIKQRERDKEIGKDEEHRGHEEMQKLHDHYIGEINKALGNKEKEIMTG